MTHDRQSKPGLGLLYRDARHAAAARISRSTMYSFEEVDRILGQVDTLKLSLSDAVSILWSASERNVRPSRVIEEIL